jgi:hypothetical protein
MSKKTIKAWAIVADGRTIESPKDITMLRRWARTRAAAQNRMRFGGAKWRVLPCTITLSPKPAKGKR